MKGRMDRPRRACACCKGLRGMGQKEVILDHLSKHGSITSDEAFELYGVYRLSARIGEIREDAKLTIKAERCVGRHRSLIVRYVLEGNAGDDQKGVFRMTRDELIKELLREKCQCGKRKMANMTFCSKCYHRLPKPLQNALYRQLGKGYEQAREEAGEYLRRELPKAPEAREAEGRLPSEIVN
jgi:hypothetical protein